MFIRLGRPAISRRRTQARQACAAVWSGLILFVLVQLGLAVAVEIALPRVRDPFYGSRLARVRRRLRDDPAKPRTVIMLGSSRTEQGFWVRSEEKDWSEALGMPVAAFNFGVPAGGPLTELLTWRRLERDGIRPDLLLVEVTIPLLGGQVAAADYTEQRLPTQTLNWRDLPLIERYAGAGRAGLMGDWLRTWPLPWYAHRFNLVSRVLPELLPNTWRRDLEWNVDKSGRRRFIEGPTTSEQRRRATQGALAEYQPHLTGFRLGGPQCEALVELLGSCRQEGVSVALVLMPEGPTFRSSYPPETWRAAQEWVTRISREYDAPLVNAREWIDDENDFRDSHHLLPIGADKFTDRLGRETIVPLLRRPSLSSH